MDIGFYETSTFSILFYFIFKSLNEEKGKMREKRWAFSFFEKDYLDGLVAQFFYDIHSFIHNNLKTKTNQFIESPLKRSNYPIKRSK